MWRHVHVSDKVIIYHRNFGLVLLVMNVSNILTGSFNLSSTSSICPDVNLSARHAEYFQKSPHNGPGQTIHPRILFLFCDDDYRPFDSTAVSVEKFEIFARISLRSF